MISSFIDYPFRGIYKFTLHIGFRRQVTDYGAQKVIGFIKTFHTLIVLNLRQRALIIYVCSRFMSKV